MTQLQKIVAKAKTLKKSHPNTKWTDLIKKASKLVTPASKSVAGTKKKKTVKKVVKKYAPVKPLAKKKKSVKKSPAKSTHKDTKSHNVNIRVMSGVNSKLTELKNLKLKLKESQSDYKRERNPLMKMYINAHKISPLKYNIKKLETELKSVKRELNKIK